jgi:signal transduction histidine kinase
MGHKSDMSVSQRQPRPTDLAVICHRVREKSESYDQYNFSSKFNDFLKAFFDLAQEFDSLEDFYRICVAVPLEMVDLFSALYLAKSEGEPLHLVCDSVRGVPDEKIWAGDTIQLQEYPYETEDGYVIPICSKQPVGNAQLHQNISPEGSRQTDLWCGVKGICGQGRILGMFEVRPLSRLSEPDKFFFVKYVNRIGFNLDNRLIARQNIDHLKFINTLVMDIEHNVIVPNMYFLHLFNQLKKKIVEVGEIEKEFRNIAGRDADVTSWDNCLDHCGKLYRDLSRYHRELVKHHANISLFLESLFRREHFEKGHLVLHPKRCFVEKEIILPQLEHYGARLRAAGISVERPENMLDQEFQIMVDVGLLAQVYANLFSNAAKYTKEIILHNDTTRKAVAYGREVVNDFPEPGRQGIKFNVFTTGPAFTPEEGGDLFKEGIRGRHCEGIPGTGHGLSFIRHVIELHGGTVGYEPTAEGNNFYFILPAPFGSYPASS